MVTSYLSQCSPFCSVTRIQTQLPAHSRPRHVRASASSSSRQPGWHWPFSKPAADHDTETEIVYVTDTADADEVIEEPEGTAPPDQLLHQQVAQASADSAAAQTEVAAAAELETSVAAARNQHEYAPEAVAAAGSHADLLHYQQQQHLSGHEPHHAAPSSTSIPYTAVVAADPVGPSSSNTAVAAAAAGYWSTSAGGWVVALSLLAAVRQGRAQADAARLDVRALQAKQHDSRVQSAALKEKRAQYLQQQQLLKEAAATKRLAEQAREAEAAKREAAAKAAEYEKAAREELDRLRARRAAAKKAFEESQGKLDEELAARTAREIALREEAEAKKAAEEAQRRAEAAAEAARAAAEATAAAEAAERAARAAAAARAAIKQRLRDASLRYTLTLRGDAAAAPVASSGSRRQLSVTLTLSPDTRAAAAGSRSRSGSGAEPAPVAHVERVYDSPDAATEGASALALSAAQQVYQHYVPAATEGITDLPGLSVTFHTGSTDSQLQQQQQQEDGDGQPGPPAVPSQHAGADGSGSAQGVMLCDADNMLWRLLLLAQLEAACRQAMGQVAPLAASGELQQELKVALSYSALPQTHDSSMQQRLRSCAELAQQQQLPAALQLLDDVIEWHLEDFTGLPGSSSSSSLADYVRQLCSSSSSSTAPSSPALPYIVPACVYAVLLNLFDPATQAINRRSSSSSSPDPSVPSQPEASQQEEDANMFDTLEEDTAGDPDTSESSPAAAGRSIVREQDSPLQRLVKFQLEQLAKVAPADELTPVAACLQQLLGRRHPVAAAVQLLAERGMSPGARQTRALRRQQKQLNMATELLQGSAVANASGGIDPQGARLRQQLVPAPERIWALRNVANSMLSSTASSGGGGSGSSGGSSSSSPSADEAVSMLRQASDLAAEHYGKDSPGRLSALLDYTRSLLVTPGHQAQAKASIEAVCGIVAAVGERYRQQRDLLSLVLLYESTQAELDVPEVISRECVAMTRLQRQAADAFSVLETAQANLVMSKRKLAPGSPSTALRQLARDCTEQLGVYAAVKKRDTRLDQWNKGLPLTPLR